MWLMGSPEFDHFSLVCEGTVSYLAGWGKFIEYHETTQCASLEAYQLMIRIQIDL